METATRQASCRHRELSRVRSNAMCSVFGDRPPEGCRQGHPTNSLILACLEKYVYKQAWGIIRSLVQVDPPRAVKPLMAPGPNR